MHLDGVHEEDKVIVRNAITALQSIKKDKVLSSWNLNVDSANKCYVITAFLADIDCEFSTRELEILHDISPLRITSVSIGKMGPSVVIRVRVSHRDVPLVITETQIVHVRKRTRWLLGAN